MLKVFLGAKPLTILWVLCKFSFLAKGKDMMFSFMFGITVNVIQIHMGAT